MKITNKAAILLLTIVMTGASESVLGHDLSGACTAEIDDVRSALNDIGSTVDGTPDGFCFDPKGLHKFGPKICDGLNKKLDDADAKLDQHKIADADKKLADFRKTLESLAYRSKHIIDMTQFMSVNIELESAETCVGELL